MAISTYGELKTAITDWMFDSSVTEAVAGDCVALAQGLLNTKLRCREMVTVTTLSPASGVFTLPSDYAQWKSVTEIASIRRPLSQISLEEAEELYPDRASGLGVHFTIYGDSLGVFPVITNDISLTYYARLSAFANDSATDWLLTRYPQVYLTAGQMFAAEHLKDNEEYVKQAQSLQRHIELVQNQDGVAEFALAAMNIEGPTP